MATLGGSAANNTNNSNGQHLLQQQQQTQQQYQQHHNQQNHHYLQQTYNHQGGPPVPPHGVVTIINDSAIVNNASDGLPSEHHPLVTSSTSPTDGGTLVASHIGDAGDGERREGWLLVRVHVPELNVHKCLQFPADQLVWDVKQQCLAALPKELKESFNYGLFSPPTNGKAGKFLDEERRLGDYPFNGPVGYLELKYKRRVYKLTKVDERQLKALHTRANLRRFAEYAQNGSVDKLSKLCAKGLDPNFHCQDTGETPLSLAACSARPARTLIALVNGGALLDYRTRDGATALHRAVEKDNLEAVRTLLELGASPNYRDCKGLTPLYASVSHKTDPAICEALLHDHATIGAKDLQGWQEVHQACRNGLVQHLEHLLAYGADMDARNASGNAPLHVCAVNARDACARLLLFRGARRQALNYSSQTPYQVAVIAGNMELAEVIRNYSNQDIVPFRGPPRYNPKRRSAAWGPGGAPLLSPSSPEPPGGNHLSPSDTQRNLHPSPEQSMVGTMPRGYHGYHGGGVLPFHGFHARGAFHFERGSPDPSSDRPFSSASSSLGSDRSHEDDVSLITDKSGGEGSESSGVGTAGSDFVVATTNGTSNATGNGGGGSTNGGGSMATFDNGSTVVCLEPYCPPPSLPGHLALQRGEVVEVTGTTDCGLLEGMTRGGAIGLFPASYVQEVRLRNSSTSNHVQTASGPGGHQQLHQERHYSATAPRIKKNNSPGMPANNYTPRDVVLHRARRGFGFVLRGAKASSPLMALRPSERCPGLQYLDDVDPGGAADMAGLRPGDFLLAINGTDVSAASHERVVELIRASGELVQMTVVSAPASHNNGPSNFDEPDLNMGAMDLNGGGGNQYHQAMRQHFATLPRKAGAGVFPGQAGGTLGRGGPAPAPPRRDPRTTLSVGRARAKSMVAGLEGGGEKTSDDLDSTGISTTKSSSAESVQMSPHMSRSDGNHSTFIYSQHDSPARQSINQSVSEYGSPGGTSNQNPSQPRTASIRQRPCSSRITAAELEELFQRQQSSTAGSGNRMSTMMCSSRFQSGVDQSPPGSPAKPRVYASVAEMKRKGKASIRAKAVAVPRVELLHRDFHSTPDLAGKPPGSPVVASLSASGSLIGSNKLQSVPNSWGTWSASRARHHSVEDVHATGARQLPPPTHPPPPPPTAGQLVAVDVSRGKSELDQNSGSVAKVQENISNTNDASADPNAVMSSFRPASSAKLYASPQDIRAVGYRSKQQEPSNRNQVRKTQSMRDPNQPAPVTQDNSNAQVNQQSNPYAQPIRKNSTNNSATLPPPIPEPDYSMSESDEEQTQSRLRSNTNPNQGNNRTGVNIPLNGDRTHVQRIKVTHGGDASTVINTDVQQRVPPSSISNDQIKATNGTNGSGSASETSGNSNASGSSTNSTSLAHSFSVDEIQKIRTRLKSSKSYPDDFLEQRDAPAEGEVEGNNDNSRTRNETAGDNSSSGVSSDQECAVDTNSKGINSESIKQEKKILPKSGNTVSQLRQQHQLEINGGVQTNLGFSKTMQRHNSLTRKQANSIALARNQGSKTLGRSAAERLGIEQSSAAGESTKRQFGNKLYPDSNLITTSSRQAVSLARLPPPAEETLPANPTNSQNATEDTFLPPPPEFVESGNERVLAPPPQFSDVQGKVRIVGAVPKNGRMGHH